MGITTRIKLDELIKTKEIRREQKKNKEIRKYEIKKKKKKREIDPLSNC